MKLLTFLSLFILGCTLSASERVRVHYYYLEELGVSPSIAVRSTLPSYWDFHRDHRPPTKDHVYTPIHFAIEQVFREMNKRIENNRHTIPQLEKVEINDGIIDITLKDDNIRKSNRLEPIRISLKLTIGENLHLREVEEFDIPEIRGFRLISANGTVYPRPEYRGRNPEYYSVIRAITNIKSEPVGVVNDEAAPHRD